MAYLAPPPSPYNQGLRKIQRLSPQINIVYIYWSGFTERLKERHTKTMILEKCMTLNKFISKVIRNYNVPFFLEINCLREAAKKFIFLVALPLRPYPPSPTRAQWPHFFFISLRASKKISFLREAAKNVLFLMIRPLRP